MEFNHIQQDEMAIKKHYWTRPDILNHDRILSKYDHRSPTHRTSENANAPADQATAVRQGPLCSEPHTLMILRQSKPSAQARTRSSSRPSNQVSSTLTSRWRRGNLAPVERVVTDFRLALAPVSCQQPRRNPYRRRSATPHVESESVAVPRPIRRRAANESIARPRPSQSSEYPWDARFHHDRSYRPRPHTSLATSPPSTAPCFSQRTPLMRRVQRIPARAWRRSLLIEKTLTAASRIQARSYKNTERSSDFSTSEILTHVRFSLVMVDPSEKVLYRSS